MKVEPNSLENQQDDDFFFIDSANPTTGYAYLRDIKDSISQERYALRWNVIESSKIHICLENHSTEDPQITQYFLYKINELGNKLTSKRQELYQVILEKVSMDPDILDTKLRQRLVRISINLQRNYSETIPLIHKSNNSQEYEIDNIDSAIHFLSSPDVLHQLMSVVSQQLAGEQSNTTFVTVSLIQCFTPKYIQIVLFARSGTGKSHLAKAALNIFPEHMIYTGFELSPTALRTATREGLLENIRIFYLTQRDGASTKARYHFKMLSSRDNDGKLKAIITDRETGKPIEMQLKPMGLISTHIDTGIIDSEEETRNVQVHLDETSEQTAKVLTYQGNQVSLPTSFQESLDRHDSTAIAVARDAIYIIEKISNTLCDYIIPYGDYLSSLIDDNKVRARAFFPMLQGWIYGSALLHFMNRDIVETPDGKKIPSSKRTRPKIRNRIC